MACDKNIMHTHAELITLSYRKMMFEAADAGGELGRGDICMEACRSPFVTVLESAAQRLQRLGLRDTKVLAC